jgi:NADH:ubiquinone oxidoreductase subunit 6 (subunit J)
MDGLRTVLGIIGFIIFVVMIVEVWRSPMKVGSKILWTIFSLICTLVALIVWFVWGRRRAYAR